jgi:hypothetical protein
MTDGKPKEYHTGGGLSRISVRRVAEPTPHFEIFKWAFTDSTGLK